MRRVRPAAHPVTKPEAVAITKPVMDVTVVMDVMDVTVEAGGVAAAGIATAMSSVITKPANPMAHVVHATQAVPTHRPKNNKHRAKPPASPSAASARPNLNLNLNLNLKINKPHRHLSTEAMSGLMTSTVAAGAVHAAHVRNAKKPG